MKRLLMVSLLISGWLAHLYPADPLSVDTTEIYFEDLTHLLSLKLFTLTKTSRVKIIHATEGRVILRPNGNTNLGLGFNYTSIGIALSFGIPQSQSSNEQKGETSSFDLQVSYFGKRIGFDGFLQGYQGYYMSNPGEHMDWDKSYYPKVSDLRVFSYGANAFYMFNSKEFSYKAAYIRNVVQKKSAGSFSPGIFFSYSW